MFQNGHLLADEPAGNPHSEQAGASRQWCRDLNAAGTTDIQVTHARDNARFGSRIVRLREGWIDSDDPAPVRAWSPRGRLPMIPGARLAFP